MYAFHIIMNYQLKDLDWIKEMQILAYLHFKSKIIHFEGMKIIS